MVMRILGFSEMWPKLLQGEFTTFRFPRKDKDWYVGEEVQIVYKPRSKEREMLGVAVVIGRARRQMLYPVAVLNVYLEEAIADGFNNSEEMEHWLIKTYGEKRLTAEPMNKLTLKWMVIKEG